MPLRKIEAYKASLTGEVFEKFEDADLANKAAAVTMLASFFFKNIGINSNNPEIVSATLEYFKDRDTSALERAAMEEILTLYKETSSEDPIPSSASPPSG